MNKFWKIFVLAMCLICSGCGKAQTSEARKDHILSGNHGWLDLTLGRRARVEGQKSGTQCELSLSINGEPFLDEFIDVAKVSDNESKIGYRFPVPVGNLQAALTIGACVKDSYVVKSAVSLTKNNLESLRFDGTTLSLQELSPYDPVSLDRLGADIHAMQSHEQSNEKTLTILVGVVVAILAANILLTLILFRKRR